MANDAESILTLCALRFDGYQWAKGRFNDLEDWDTVVEKFVRNNTPSADLVLAFAIFFRMQRTLCKGSSGFFGAATDYNRAAVRLFLFLESLATPQAYIDSDYHHRWTALSPDLRAAAVQHAQAWLANHQTTPD